MCTLPLPQIDVLSLAMEVRLIVQKADAMLVNGWLEKNTNSWNRKKINIQKDTGLSALRVNAALKRLGREDLR